MKDVEIEEMGSQEDGKRKYAKLTPELKQEFLRKIIFNNMTIKQASELLNINYSSAKAILSLHKKSKTSSPRKITQKLAAKMTGFAELNSERQTNGIVGICCSIGGLVISDHEYQHYRTKPIHKEKIKCRRETDHEDSPYH